MILISHEVLPSRIPGAGMGLFSTQTLPAGRVISAPSHIEETITIDELLAVPDHPHSHCSVRWFEQHCTVSPDWPNECFVNHSFSPNGLWHLGFIFSLRDIVPGDEITVDYRHLLGPGVRMDFLDSLTGQPIIGHDWKESLIHSTRTLLGILENVHIP